MTYFDYFKVFLLKVGILNFVHISDNKNNYCDIERDEFEIYYSLNDKLHRIDGPAIECVDGTKYWYQNGELHRIDGPAEECPNGDKYWYYEDKLIDCNSQEEFERYLKLKLFW